MEWKGMKRIERDWNGLKKDWKWIENGINSFIPKFFFFLFFCCKWTILLPSETSARLKIFFEEKRTFRPMHCLLNFRISMAWVNGGSNSNLKIKTNKVIFCVIKWEPHIIAYNFVNILFQNVYYFRHIPAPLWAI